jgi:phage-related protein
MKNEGASDVYAEVERRRETASHGHGTTTVKCSYDKYGLHEDEVITNK